MTPRGLGDLDPVRVDQAVRRAGRSSVNREDTLGGAVDLSRAAVLERQRAKARGADGGFTGRELVDVAAANFDRAKQLQKVSLEARRPARRAKASKVADQALLTAAAQIRIAGACPLERGYLHALTLEQIQTVQAEVRRAAGEDLAALAVDTHMRIRDQRNRIRAEGAAPA